MMGRRIEYSVIAVKALARLHPLVSKAIRAKIALLASDPGSLANNIKALKGTRAFRLRVGDYRVIYTESLEILRIEKVGHRSDIYE